ncbi:unnamed protein product [Colias eurytheme]|nr:unnamed protein product [Colias eurytheme]
MNIEGDGNSDEYIVTAIQIFEYCGADSSSTLRVDALMDKFAPFIKTNRAEYSYLKSLLDPDQNNPEITVSKLADSLNKYSESQKVKVDLEESFNLKSGQVPHDSDSGISTDGFQLLEELQCELREKSHIAHQLRSQLEFTDRQHEEAMAALTAERDSLRSHLNMLREENATLTHVRHDYEDVCERLCASERALDDTRRELDGSKRRARLLAEQVGALESEKTTLSELLTKSKEECHRINELYAGRQVALLEHNERLRAAHADLSARLRDQHDALQTVLSEKVLLEMELKDMLNKTNQTHLKLDRSIDVSYTEDQMLTALDSLNADSRFSSDNQILDEESFVNKLKEEQGRATNMSLFDEIRLSFCNMSRTNITEISSHDKLFDTSFINAATQTDETEKTCMDAEIQTIQSIMKLETKSTQTIGVNRNALARKIPKLTRPIKRDPTKILVHTSIQTETNTLNNNTTDVCKECTNCKQLEQFNDYTTKLESDFRNSHATVAKMRREIDSYENNLNVLKKFVDEGNERNNYMRTVVDSLKAKLVVLEEKCMDQGERIKSLCCETCAAEAQTECDQVSVCSQTDLPCSSCVKRNTPHRLRRYLWEPLRCLFQMFAVICFLCAISVLYNVTQRWHTRCSPITTWSWLQPHDLMDLLFRIEYVADVPM